MVEILGNNLASLFENTKLNGVCTYKGIPKKEFDITYEVWEVSDEDFTIMCNMTEERFNLYCCNGWWRYSEGSVLGVPDCTFYINGESIIAWAYRDKDDWCDDCGEDTDEGVCHECMMNNRTFTKLTEYLCDEIGASLPKNVCALALDLAKYNNMKMSDLFRKYEG